MTIHAFNPYEETRSFVNVTKVEKEDFENMGYTNEQIDLITYSGFVNFYVDENNNYYLCDYYDTECLLESFDELLQHRLEELTM